MVVTRDRQNMGRGGKKVSLKMKGCPSPSLLGIVLFFLMLSLGFPGEDFLYKGAGPRPVGGEVRKAAAPSPLGGKKTEQAESLPVVPFLLYQVEKNETISLIAARYSLKTETLISLNRLADPREVVLGRSLYIPSQDGARKSLSGDMTAEDLAEIFSLSPDLLVPLGKGDFFLPGVEPGQEEIGRFWEEDFSYPLNGSVTGEYGERVDVLTGLSLKKNGLDFRTYRGQDIYSIGDGVVSKAGFHGTYGWYMIVNHRDGFQSLYAHLDSFEASEGDRVDRGEKIATAGDSGHTPGNILFFSLFEEGDAVDPKDYLF
ncbi:MAG: LysM peptidoglycan-binding domain-containing M23 family metallopeptidase [Spirochaetales bacterium]|nr:LysM peptidoglycan-binding domain-containing M23 family metallopeptidase [Spirochaetales bacterium]